MKEEEKQKKYTKAKKAKNQTATKSEAREATQLA